MIVSREIHKTVRAVAGPMLAVALVAYFGLNAFQSDRGVLRLIELEREIDRAEEGLQTVEARRVRLEARVGALSGRGLDPDYLDERTRTMTGFLDPRDAILSGVAVSGRRSGKPAVLGLPAEFFR